MHPPLERPKRRFVGATLCCLGLIGVGVTLASVVANQTASRLELIACFSHVGGLEAGDDVTLNGVRVGRVSSLRLDADQRPCTELSLEADLVLDYDTSAAIFTKNVLGEKYIALDPGGADEQLLSGDEIHFTQSALPIERIMIQLLERQIGSSFE